MRMLAALTGEMHSRIDEVTIVIWHDTRSSEGELLYSIRGCGKYSVWPDGESWYGYHHPDGCLFGQRVWRSSKCSSASAAQVACRDHLVENSNG